MWCMWCAATNLIHDGNNVAHVLGDWQHVELIIKQEAVLARGEGQNEALIEARCDMLVGLCAEPGMHVLCTNMQHEQPQVATAHAEQLTMLRAYSCLNDFIVCSSNTTMPPPSTVSIVRHRMFGVSASKSWQTSAAQLVWLSAYKHNTTARRASAKRWKHPLLTCSTHMPYVLPRTLAVSL